MTVPLLRDIALAFLPLSFATIGGGQSAIAGIHRQVVELHGWLTAVQFLDDYAIARMAPGPGSLFVTLIGWHIAGPLGSLVATISIFLPTSLLMYGVATVWRRYSGARFLLALEAGLRPVAAGLVLATVYVLMQSLGGGWIGPCVALVSTAIFMRSHANPLILIGAGAALFMGLGQVGVL